MTRAELLRELESELELSPLSLHGPEELANYPAWDSLTQMNFLVYLDAAKNGMYLTPQRISECRTAQELVDACVFGSLNSTEQR